MAGMQDSPVEAPSLAGRLSGMKKNMGKMRVSASMDFLGVGGGSNKYQREEIKRLRSEIAASQAAIENWNPEAVASQALKSLKTDLAVKKARLLESKARLSE